MRTHAGRCVAASVQQLELAEFQGGRTFPGGGHMLGRFLVQIKVLLDITFIALVRRPLVIAFILEVFLHVLFVAYAAPRCVGRVLHIAFISLVSTQLSEVVGRSFVLLLNRHAQAVALLLRQVPDALGIQFDLRDDADQQLVHVVVQATRRLDELAANLLRQFLARWENTRINFVIA